MDQQPSPNIESFKRQTSRIHDALKFHDANENECTVCAAALHKLIHAAMQPKVAA